MDAMDRACQLIEELGAGEVVGGAVDFYPVKKERSALRMIRLRSTHFLERIFQKKI